MVPRGVVDVSEMVKSKICKYWQNVYFTTMTIKCCSNTVSSQWFHLQLRYLEEVVVENVKQRMPISQSCLY